MPIDPIPLSAILEGDELFFHEARIALSKLSMLTKQIDRLLGKEPLGLQGGITIPMNGCDDLYVKIDPVSKIYFLTIAKDLMEQKILMANSLDFLITKYRRSLDDQSTEISKIMLTKPTE